MAPKIPDTSPSSDAAVGARLQYAWGMLGTKFEEAIEGTLDLVLGPATEKGLRHDGEGMSKKKKKNKSKKRLLRELRRQKEQEDALQLEYESSLKAERLAERIRKLEQEEADHELELKESEVGNRNLILQFTLVQVASLYAVSQACLLAIFVPQKCPAVIAANYTSPWFTYNEDLPDGHLCSMKENLDWFNDSKFNQAVIMVNIITLAVMLLSQSYFWKREVWFVEHLQEDNSVPYDSLPHEIKGYEEFETIVGEFNVGAYAYASTLMFMIVCNLTLSTYFLLEGDGYYNYSLGSRTITGLLTNTMLVSTKIMGFWSYARLSYENSWAISLFTVIPLSYNRVDDEYKERKVKTVEEMQAEIAMEEFPRRPEHWGKEDDAEEDMI